MTGSGNGEIVLDIAKNDNVTERTAYVVISNPNEGFFKVIEIKQAGGSELKNGLPSPSQVDPHDIYYRTSDHHSILKGGSGVSMTDAYLLIDTYYYDEDAGVDYGVMHHQDKYTKLCTVEVVNNRFSNYLSQFVNGMITTPPNFDTLTDMVTHQDVSSLSESQFDGCDNLKTFSVPTKLTSIPKNCFKDCTSLENVNLGYSLISVGESAFEGVSGIKSVTFAPECSTIGKCAFKNCSNLEEITFTNISGVNTDCSFNRWENRRCIVNWNDVDGVTYYAEGLDQRPDDWSYKNIVTFKQKN